MQDLLEVEYQRNVKLAGLFQHSGWKIFEDMVKDQLEYHKGAIENILRNPLKPEDLPNLNEHSARRNAYEQILLLKQELVEEITPDDPSQGLDVN